MKSRFSCISVFVLQLEDTDDGAVSTKALLFKNSSHFQHNLHSLLTFENHPSSPDGIISNKSPKGSTCVLLIY